MRPRWQRTYLGSGEGHAQDRVGSEVALVLSAVEADHQVVDSTLVGRVLADNFFGQDVVHVGDCLDAALAAVAIAAIAELAGFVGPGGGSGRDTRAVHDAIDGQVDLNGGVAATVDDFTRENAADGAGTADLAVDAVAHTSQCEKRSSDGQSWNGTTSLPAGRFGYGWGRGLQRTCLFVCAWDVHS